MDLDLVKEFCYKILVERIGFSFFVEIKYEKFHEFCNLCTCIGHSLDKCRRREINNGKKLKFKLNRLRHQNGVLFNLKNRRILKTWRQTFILIRWGKV